MICLFCLGYNHLNHLQTHSSIENNYQEKELDTTDWFPDPPVGTITVITPNSTSYWSPGNSYEVKWEWTGNFDKVIIALTTEEGYHSMSSVITENDGSYIWYIPYDLIIGGDDYRIYIANIFL